jgi:sn-glycerol 3-phosphate transport system ATP-binding protein
MVEVLGADSYAYGVAGHGATVAARLPHGTRAALGDDLPLTFDATHMHWFDADSGKRLQ